MTRTDSIQSHHAPVCKIDISANMRGRYPSSSNGCERHPAMPSPLPSEKAFVPFVSVANMMRLVHHIGIEAALSELTEIIEADFRRWQSFDKTPRVATHSGAGVIELMPTSDGEIYSFK